MRGKSVDRDTEILAQLIKSRIECEWQLMEFFSSLPEDNKEEIYSGAIQILEAEGSPISPPSVISKEKLQ